MPIERKMVLLYSDQTSTTQRKVRPLLMPTKKFSVTPAMMDNTTGTSKKAQTATVTAS